MARGIQDVALPLGTAVGAAIARGGPTAETGTRHATCTRQPGVKPLRIDGERDLASLAGGTSLHRISLYTPVEQSPSGRHASALRLRAGIDRAEERLRARGVREEEISARLEIPAEQQPALGSLEEPVRSLVWFGDEAGWAWAPLAQELPERVCVAQHFALRPLIRALHRNRRFRVLALSANRVQAYEGDRRGLRPVAVEGLPGSLEDALGSDVEGRGLSFRSEQPVPGQRANAPIYHGHGGASDERALDRERFHRVLAAALDAAWGAESPPLVLAAEVRTAGELRKHADLPCLLDEELRGNPDDASLDALHAGAWRIVEATFDERERALAGDFERARNAGKALDRDLEAVAAATIAGRVRRLWIEEGARVPGRLDAATARRVEVDDPDEDALDGLVTQVILRAGEVHVVDEGATPTGGSYCVELR